MDSVHLCQMVSLSSCLQLKLVVQKGNTTENLYMGKELLLVRKLRTCGHFGGEN